MLNLIAMLSALAIVELEYFAGLRQGLINVHTWLGESLLGLREKNLKYAIAAITIGLLALSILGLIANKVIWIKLIYAATLLSYCLANAKVFLSENLHGVVSPIVDNLHLRFVILFYFMVCGLHAMLIYWLLVYALVAADSCCCQKTIKILRFVQQIFLWLPARLLAFLYALMGDFSESFASWRKLFLSGSIEEMLQSCGQVAIHANNTQEELNLVKRSILCWIIMSALSCLLNSQMTLIFK